ncbi:MAG: alpha-amylase family glycosyl hydrolase, partial [Bacteroidota bacterium]
TSNQHPWFTQSAANANNFRDWYIWSPNHPGYSGPWGQPVWHNNGGEFYYGLFWGGMPDLNYNHPPVKAELFNVANFWLDKGVDGFRLDAIKYLIEDGNQLENTPANFALLEEFHDVYAANNPDAVTVGEVWSNTASIIPYVQNDRLDICFEFDLAGSLIYGVNNGNPESIQLQMEQIQAAYPTLQYGTFLTNHDMDRIFNQISSNTERMKLAAALYLTLPGVPFIYYGEEVKMTGTGAHENIRRPMQWSSAQYGGFSTTAPWIGLGANYTSNNVAVMEADPNSLLNHYKKLVHIRNKQSPLRRGNYLPVSSTANQVLSFARIHDNQAVMIASNLGTATANPTFNLAASNLIPGEYTVKDLYNDQDLGTLTINGNGGFSAWTPLSNGLAARNTSILSITADPSVNTINLEPTNFDFSLFPNPGHQTINIQSNLTATQKGTITIYSSNGQAIYEGVMNGESLTLDTADWAKGVYIVQLRVNGQLSVQRLLIL